MQAIIESFESRVLMSATPVLTKIQKQDIKKITADLVRIYTTSDISAAQLTAVGADVTAIKGVAHKPTASTIKTLKLDTKAAFADKVIATDETAKLTADTQAVLTSAGVSSTLASQAATDVQSIVASSGVTKAQANGLINDVSALLKTFKI